jgi:hypothetical protein
VDSWGGGWVGGTVLGQDEVWSSDVSAIGYAYYIAYSKNIVCGLILIHDFQYFFLIPSSDDVSR